MATQTLPRSPGSGWVARSLTQSLSRTVSIGLSVCQLFVGMAVLASTPLLPYPLLLAAHAAVATLALLAIRFARLRGWLIAALYAVLLLDLIASPHAEDVLPFAAMWMSVLIAVAPFSAYFSYKSLVFSAVSAALVAAMAAGVNPEITTVASAVGVSSLAMSVGLWVGTVMMARFATNADRSMAKAARNQLALSAARAAAAESTEASRILHDTVINTLAAIASGGAATRDVAAVRDRCQRDLSAVAHLLDELPREAGVDPSLFEVTAVTGIRVIRTGASDADLASLEGALSDRVRIEMAAAAHELVQNAAKHAGVEWVQVDRTILPDRMIVRVIDTGIGFDPGAIIQRGLATSVHSRIEGLGGSVQIDSTPGKGTVVTCSVPLQVNSRREDEPVKPADTARVVRAAKSRACWAWLAGVITMESGLGLLMLPSAMFAILSIHSLLVAAGLLAWISVRRTGFLGAWAGAAITGLMLVFFIAALRMVDFGHGNMTIFPAMGIDVPLVLLLTFDRSRRWLWGGLISIAGVIFAVGALGPAGDARSLLAVVVATLPGTLMLVGWMIFHQQLEIIATKLANARHEAFVARVEAHAQEAGSAARARWRVAGLRDTADLLVSVAAGRVHPDSIALQRACADEERYLRQLIQLSPNAYRMNLWWARALHRARARSVQLALRAGDVDIDSESTAESLGLIVLGVIETARESTEITVSLVRSRGGTQLLVVGRQLQLADTLPTRNGWAIDHRSIGGQELLEISLA